MKYSLDGSWKLGFIHPESKKWTELSATVPGYAEEALANNGLLGELYPCDDMDATSAFSLTQWHYTREFDALPVPEGLMSLSNC